MFCIILLLSLNTSQINIPTPRKLQPMTQWPISPVFWYTMIKEIACLASDRTSSKSTPHEQLYTFIHCRNCEMPLNLYTTMVHCAYNKKYKALLKIRSLISDGDLVKIQNFLLAFHERFQTSCEHCNAYYGWHINAPSIVEAM
jgi:hypothetical protein